MLSQEPDAIVASKYCVNAAPHPDAIMQLLYTLEQAEMRHATTGSDPIPVPGLAVVGAVLEPVVCTVVGGAEQNPFCNWLEKQAQRLVNTPASLGPVSLATIGYKQVVSQDPDLLKAAIYSSATGLQVLKETHALYLEEQASVRQRTSTLDPEARVVEASVVEASVDPATFVIIIAPTMLE